MNGPSSRSRDVAPPPNFPGGEEALRRCARDLVALSTLPAALRDSEPGDLARSMAGMLASMLRAEVVVVELLGLKTGPLVAVAGPAGSRASAPDLLAQARAEASRSAFSAVGSLRFFSVPVGPLGQDGLIVAGASGEGFPDDVDRLIGNVAANQTAVAFESARRRLAEREASAALRESEERLRLTVEGARDYAIFMLGPDGRVETWNGGAQRIFGYTAAEIVGRSPDHVYAASERDLFHESLREAERGGRAEHESLQTRRDGTQFWAHVITTALRDEKGGLRGFVRVARDVTERKRAEAEIRALNESLEERVRRRTAELEEAMGELEGFSYSVAHDLRAPLRGLFRYSELLQEDYAGKVLDEEGLEFSRKIAAAAGKMDRLIEDLLGYSRLTRARIELRRVDLAALVADVLRGMEDELRGKGAEVKVEEPLPAVLGDPVMLTQAISNLLSNAVKFVPPGRAPRIGVGSESLGSRIRLWVRDNGIGISPPNQEKLFRLFERIEPAYPGTGVGLAIVKKSVEKIGGRVGVESRSGEGSGFWIDLRKAEET